MTGLPDGFGIDLDRSVRSYRDGAVLAGGHPGRLLTLGPAGVEAVAALVGGQPVSPAGRRLGGRLVEAGLAHPRWDGEPAGPGWDERVTAVVPTLDRSASLDRCLEALGPGARVVVVDDGSAAPEALASVCARYGARLLTRARNGGPGVARNDALAAVSTEFVAFVDSDCTVTEGWLGPLLRLFDDPAIGAVAPRLRPEPSGPDSVRRRYSDARSPLDMGTMAGEVGPERSVRYLPTAALIVRRSALDTGFDPSLRVGEDVDLVWRLVSAGWRVRYEPSVAVRHREPSRWGDLLVRRFRYGTSAAPLAERHPGRLAPVELRAEPGAAVAALLAGWPAASAALVAASGIRMAVTLVPRGVSAARALALSALGAGWTLVGVGRAVTILAAPAALAVSARSRRVAAATALLLVAPPAVEWWQRRPRIDPVRWTVASIVDDMAYGLGVWAGCLATRTVAPLVPSFRNGGLGGVADRRRRCSRRPTPTGRHPETV